MKRCVSTTFSFGKQIAVDRFSEVYADHEAEKRLALLAMDLMVRFLKSALAGESSRDGKESVRIPQFYVLENGHYAVFYRHSRVIYKTEEVEG